MFIREHPQKNILNLLFLELLLVFFGEIYINRSVLNLSEHFASKRCWIVIYCSSRSDFYVSTCKVLYSLHRHKNGVPHHSGFIIIGVEQITTSTEIQHDHELFYENLDVKAVMWDFICSSLPTRALHFVIFLWS